MYLLHLIIAFAFVVASGIPSPASEQIGTDRPGGDYRSFDLTAINASPKDCKAACYEEQNCRAWTFVNAGIQGRSARCWLKNVVPNAVVNPCCTSGVTQRID